MEYLKGQSKAGAFLPVLIFFLLLFIATPGVLQAQTNQSFEGKTIGKVQIIGNTIVSADKISNKITSREGAVFNEKLISSDARNILTMPEIFDVKWQASMTDSGVELIYFVIESKVIKSVEIKGNKSIKTKKLNREVKIKSGDPLDSFLINNGITAIEEAYRKKGFHKVRVSVNEERLNKEFVLVYTVVEGPKVRINKLKFTGNKSVIAWKLKGKVKSKPYFPIFRKGLLNQKQLEDDSLALATYYHSLGYLDAQVFSRTTFNEKGNRVQVEFVVDEGIKYHIIAVQFVGNKLYSDEKLKETTNIVPGDVLSEETQLFAVRSIKRLYGEQGYIYSNARIEQEFTDNEGEVIVVINVTEGDSYYLGRLIVKGNSVTRDKVVRRNFDYYGFFPGGLYNTDAANKGKTRLQQSGLFGNIRVTPIGNDPKKRDALIEVEERQTGLLTFGLGVGSNNGAFGQFSVQERNFDISKLPKNPKDWFKKRNMRGGGQSLQLNLFPGTEETRGSIRFREPYLFDQPYYFDFNAYLSRRYRESHLEKRRGVSVTIGHRFDNALSADVSLKVERVIVSDLDMVDFVSATDPNDKEVFDRQKIDPRFVSEGKAVRAQRDVEAVEGGNMLASVKVGLGYDKTDSIYRPTEGYKLTGSWEQFGHLAGEFDFSKIRASASFYKPLSEDLSGRKTVWAARVKYGGIIGDAPTFERFYVGGIGSLRGFDYRGVSYRPEPEKEIRDNDPVGSDFELLAGTEIIHPLYEDTVYGKIFYDTALIDTGGIRMSLGFGVEIYIPQLFQQVPMQLNFGIPISRESEDETEVFSFSFGLNL